MDQFLGQIALVPYTFAPRGWAFCQGQLMAISQNSALFALLGTYFGGDGRSTFGLPNLQGNIAIGTGTGTGLQPITLGEAAGTVNVTLTTAQMTAHNHQQLGSTNAATVTAAANNNFGPLGGRGHATSYYQSPPGSNLAVMGPQAISPAGGNQAHDNLMPYLALNYIICTSGIFPERP